LAFRPLARRWGGGTRRSPLPSGRELSSGGRRTDGSCTLGAPRTVCCDHSRGGAGYVGRGRQGAPLAFAEWSLIVVGWVSNRRFVHPRRPRTTCRDHSRGGVVHWTRRPGGPVAVSWTGSGPPVRACRARGGGTRRSPSPSGRELSSGRCPTDGSGARGARGRCVVTARGAGLRAGAPGVVRYACSAVFSWMPSPLRCSASTAPLTLLRRNRMFGVPESSAALTVFGVPSGFGAAPTSTTLVLAVT